MKNILTILSLAFVVSGCATTDWPSLASFGLQNEEPIEQVRATTPTLAPDRYAPKSLAYAPESEWLLSFVSKAQTGAKISTDLGQGGVLVTTLEKSFTSARGRRCKRVRFEPDDSVFSSPGVVVVFCRGQTGWKPVTPLQKVNFSEIGMSRILEYSQATARN